MFKRGDTFYSGLTIVRSGISGCPMVIAAYGTGAKPLLFGSRQENLTTDWVVMGGNIWQNNEWTTIYTSDELIGDCKVVRFPTYYQTSQIRLKVLKASVPLSIYELNIIKMQGLPTMLLM